MSWYANTNHYRKVVETGGCVRAASDNSPQLCRLSAMSLDRLEVQY